MVELTSVSLIFPGNLCTFTAASSKELTFDFGPEQNSICLCLHVLAVMSLKCTDNMPVVITVYELILELLSYICKHTRLVSNKFQEFLICSLLSQYLQGSKA